MSFEIHRGTNISHWLSQSQARGDERRRWFTRANVEQISRWDFDHLRLPVDEEQLWATDGSREPEGFELLLEALDWCHQAGLRVVVDLHILRSHYFNDEDVPALYTDPAEGRRFAALWGDLSSALGSLPTDLVAYELLNQAVAPTSHAWNVVWRLAYEVIRANEPDRTIVLGSNRFNQCQTFPKLSVPRDDNLMLTFHYYNPMFVTHYTAPWWRQGGSYAGPIRYPGRPIPDSQHIAVERLRDAGIEHENRDFDCEVMITDMKVPLSIADAAGHPLYCGEFGCYEHTPPDIREAWYRDMARAFRELDIAWANWDYKGNFGLIDDSGKETGVRSWFAV